MNGNDSAYPSHFEQYNPEFGLTKRELFAAMAMQGILAYPHGNQSVGVCASVAVKAADALIAELTKEVQNDN